MLKTLLLSPTAPVVPAGKVAQCCRLKLTKPKAVVCAPQPPSTPKHRTRGRFQLGSSTGVVPRVSSQLDCCLCLGEIFRRDKAGSKLFQPHYRWEWWLSMFVTTLMFMTITGEPGVWSEWSLEFSQPWRGNSEWILCLHFIFLKKKIKAQKRISFDLLLFALAVTKRDKATTCWQALAAFNCWKSESDLKW